MKLKVMLIISTLFIFLTSLAAAQDYIVGGGDVLKIVVYENDDLTTTVRVSEEEVIVFPLIGRVNVKNMSISQLEDKITNLLADGYLIDPNVSIFIEEFGSRKVTILGQVNNPGVYELREEITLLELLSKAGGVKEDAGGEALIKRKKNSEGSDQEIIRIDLAHLLEGGDMSLNEVIMDSDNIYISKVGLFYVNGEVNKPSAYKHDPETTLIKAVTMAGGFTGKASKNKIKIVRKIDGLEVVIDKARMDAEILPEDIIIVPESFF